MKNPKTAGISLHKSYISEISFEHTSNRFRDLLKFFNDKNIQFNIPYAGIHYGNYQYYVDFYNKISKFPYMENICDSNILDYDCYVVIRNPIDRLHSVCRHIKSKQPGKGLLHLLFENEFKVDNFSSDIESLWDSFSFDDIALKLISCQNVDPRLGLLKRPQSYYCTNTKVIKLDYSNLQKEVDNLCSKYNIPLGTLPRLNTEQHRYTDNFSEKVINQIKKVYADDFQIYNSIRS